jgi:hypothetical protein
MFVGFMMTYRASDRGTRHAVMARHVAHKSADHRSFDASRSKGRRGGSRNQEKDSANNHDWFHDALPYRCSFNACNGGAFHSAWCRVERPEPDDEISDHVRSANQDPKV